LEFAAVLADSRRPLLPAVCITNESGVNTPANVASSPLTTNTVNLILETFTPREKLKLSLIEIATDIGKRLKVSIETDRQSD
jgi:hypothetical protein